MLVARGCPGARRRRARPREKDPDARFSSTRELRDALLEAVPAGAEELEYAPTRTFTPLPPTATAVRRRTPAVLATATPADTDPSSLAGTRVLAGSDSILALEPAGAGAARRLLATAAAALLVGCAVGGVLLVRQHAQARRSRRAELRDHRRAEHHRLRAGPRGPRARPALATAERQYDRPPVTHQRRERGARVEHSKALAALAVLLATGCAQLPSPLDRPFRTPGEKLADFPEDVRAEYGCEKAPAAGQSGSVGASRGPGLVTVWCAFTRRSRRSCRHVETRIVHRGKAPCSSRCRTDLPAAGSSTF
jgi:hypothetical protein